MLIEAHEATIQTATVEIRTLTVTGRQVTLALFRQLEEERIEDLEDGRLHGEPWGRVNYCPGKCDGGKGHLHLVWQLGDELRRATVRPPQAPGGFYGDSRYGAPQVWARSVESGDTWLRAALLDGWRPEKTEIDEHDNRAVLVDFSAPVWIYFSAGCREFLNAAYTLEHRDLDDRTRARGQEWLAEAKETIEEEIYLLDAGAPTVTDAARRIEQELRDQDERYARRLANWQRFLSLPQLFIAT